MGAGFVIDSLGIYNIAQILNVIEVNHHMLWPHFSEKFLIYQYLLKAFSKIKENIYIKCMYIFLKKNLIAALLNVNSTTDIILKKL